MAFQNSITIPLMESLNNQGISILSESMGFPDNWTIEQKIQWLGDYNFITFNVVHNKLISVYNFPTNASDMFIKNNCSKFTFSMSLLKIDSLCNLFQHIGVDILNKKNDYINEFRQLNMNVEPFEFVCCVKSYP